MCDHGDTVTMVVPIEKRHSCTGSFRWANKPVDRCLAPLVRALIAGGVHTSGACCGHGKGPGLISLHDGRELRVLEAGDVEG